MAAEYGALLKWPKDKAHLLQELKGHCVTIELEVVTRDEVKKYNIDLPKDWNLDSIYNGCYQHIKPVKDKYLSGAILKFYSREN
jgi:hypothetical protein